MELLSSFNLRLTKILLVATFSLPFGIIHSQILESEIKADGIVFPSMDTNARDLLTAVQGQCIYNIDNNSLECFDGTNWAVTSNSNMSSSNFDGITGTVQDIEGNTYQTVIINNQIWMAENLRVTKYNDGTIIPEITDGATWTNLNSEAWCWYNNSNSYDIPYGKLYNWHAVNNNNICPIGWHVPTDQEWSEIVEYFDPANFDNTSLTESSTAGGLMKQTGLINWSSPNTGATNTKGLTLIAGGYRSSPSFFELGERGIYWSSTEESPTKAWCRWFYNFLEVVDKWNFTKNQGLSIRCVKD